MHRAGQHHVVEYLLDGFARLNVGHPFGQSIANTKGSKLAFMADTVLAHAVIPGSKGRERHPLAIAGQRLQLGQHGGAFGVTRRQLHHHPILVELVVQGGHLALREGVVQHRGDGLHIYAQAPRRFTVDIQHDLTRLIAVHRVHVGQQRALFHRLCHRTRPLFQRLQRIRAQQHLVLATAERRAEEQVLLHHQKHHDARNLRRSRAQALYHLLRRGIALGQGFKLDRQLRIGQPPVAAGGAGQVRHRRVLQDVLPVGFDLWLHDLKRQAVIATQEAVNLAAVLLRQ